MDVAGMVGSGGSVSCCAADESDPAAALGAVDAPEVAACATDASEFTLKTTDARSATALSRSTVAAAPIGAKTDGAGDEMAVGTPEEIAEVTGEARKLMPPICDARVR